MLDSMYGYNTEGAGFFLKIHPVSYMLTFMLLVLTVMFGIRRDISFFFKEQFGLFQFACVNLLICIWYVFVFGTSGVAYIVDTYFAAFVFLFFLAKLSILYKQRILSFIIYFITFNSVLALVEFTFGLNFFEPPRNFGFFRATALFGHPLTNSLISAVIALASMNLECNFWKKWIFVLINLFSILAFGGRAAFVFTLAGIFVFIFQDAVVNNFGFEKFYKSFSYNLIFGCIFVFVMIFLLYYNDIGSGFRNRMYYDTSAQVRLDSLFLLKKLSISELMWGNDNYYIYKVSMLLPEAKNIENFWIVLLLRYGIVFFVLFIISYCCFCWDVLKKNGFSGIIIMILFTLICSSNNSLSFKDPSLMCVFTVVYLLQNYRSDASSVEMS